MATRTSTAKKAQPKPTLMGVYTPRAGDLIFVRPAADDAVGQLVAAKTNGPYCHVRIRISAEEVVEALPSGVTRAFVHPPEPFASDCAATGAGLNAARRTAMLAWLAKQVGQPYSFWDIAADVLKALLPRAWGSRTPFLIQPSRFDCSALAAVAIVAAGYPLAPDLIADVARLSPNDLARAVGVLK